MVENYFDVDDNDYEYLPERSFLPMFSFFSVRFEFTDSANIISFACSLFNIIMIMIRYDIVMQEHQLSCMTIDAAAFVDDDDNCTL